MSFSQKFRSGLYVRKNLKVELKNCSLVSWSNIFTYLCKDNWMCHNKVGRQQWYVCAEPLDDAKVDEKQYLLRLYVSEMKEVGTFSSEDHSYRGGIDALTLAETYPRIYLEGKVFPIIENGQLILNGKSPLQVLELRKKPTTTLL